MIAARVSNSDVAKVVLSYKSGDDDDYTTKDLTKSGSHYALNDERIGQGRERAVEWLRERPQVTEELAQRILTTPKPGAPQLLPEAEAA